MAQAFLSTLWYRVASLKPRLRAHVRVSRHRYRGQPWYVLHDIAAGRIHRFTPAAYLVVGQLDGTRSVDQVWRGLAETHEAEAPSQDDVIRLLSTLHQNDLIQYEGSPDVADLLERHNRQAGQVLRQNLTNPISFRLPLWDPDAFLGRTLPWIRPLTGWFGLLLWVVVVASGLATAALNWSALTGNVADRLLGMQNILITLASYPLLKALHELGHGYLTKARGGEVREMGVMLLVFFPVPYVDASASAAFPGKWQRAAVAAGGILVETFVAALAVTVWAEASDGFVRALAFNLALIGGISTLLVNGNPLLRYDGYYVLCDLIEIPNLGQRANAYLGHLVERRLFGATQLREISATRGEKVWFLIYAPAAFVYRLTVMLGIAGYIATRFFVIGMALAAWSLFNAFLKPLAKQLRHVATAPQLRKVRRRAMGLTYGGLALAILIVALVPVPLRTDTEGVVWVPDAAHLRARTSGFVEAVDVAQDAEVGTGAVLVRLTEPTIDARIAALRARVEELRRHAEALDLTDRAQAEVARLQMGEAVAELERERVRRDELVLRAPVDGRFEPVLPPAALPGRYIAEGDLVGYVLPPRPDRIRIVVSQDDQSLVRDRLRRVEVKLAGRMERAWETRLIREVPSALNTLPSAALGRTAGGRFVVDPSDRDGLRMIDQAFLYDLALPEGLADAPYGARVIVRFDHGTEPAALQGWRRLRQLFLRLFDA